MTDAKQKPTFYRISKVKRYNKETDKHDIEDISIHAIDEKNLWMKLIDDNSEGVTVVKKEEYDKLLVRIETLREALIVVEINGADRGIGWTPALHARIALEKDDEAKNE